MYAERTFKFENSIDNLGGLQDQYMAVRGGLRYLCFKGEKVKDEPLKVDNQLRNWLSSNFLLFDSGIKHSSVDVHKRVWNRIACNDVTALGGITLLKTAAHKMAAALAKGDRSDVVSAFNAVCDGVDLLDEKIHEPFRGILQPLVADQRVKAWKALGAGAGGASSSLLKIDQ